MPTNSNRLLDALLPESRAAILAVAKQVPLSIRTSLQAQEESPRFVYFLTSGVASVVVRHVEGSSAETALIGREGVTSALAFLGSAAPTAECFMQVSGAGLRVPLANLQQLFDSSVDIRTRILQCVQQEAMTTTQIAACNVAHEAEARLARWLLMVSDRTGDLQFQLTQEFISQMLGARRTTVALAAGSLQTSGFIEYTRGRVTILSHEELQTAACDCYGVTRRLFTDLYAKLPPRQG